MTEGRCDLMGFCSGCRRPKPDPFRPPCFALLFWANLVVFFFHICVSRTTRRKKRKIIYNITMRVVAQPQRQLNSSASETYAANAANVRIAFWLIYTI